MGGTLKKYILPKKPCICQYGICSLSSKRMDSTEKPLNGGWMSVVQFI